MLPITFLRELILRYPSKKSIAYYSAWLIFSYFIMLIIFVKLPHGKAEILFVKRL